MAEMGFVLSHYHLEGLIFTTPVTTVKTHYLIHVPFCCEDFLKSHENVNLLKPATTSILSNGFKKENSAA